MQAGRPRRIGPSQIRVGHEGAARRGGQRDSAFAGHPVAIRDHSPRLRLVAVLGVDLGLLALSQCLDDFDRVTRRQILGGFTCTRGHAPRLKRKATAVVLAPVQECAQSSLGWGRKGGGGTSISTWSS